MTTGQTFVNGVGPVRARNFGWHETLTVVRRDYAGYGVERYIVRDRYGRLGYAY